MSQDRRLGRRRSYCFAADVGAWGLASLHRDYKFALFRVMAEHETTVGAATLRVFVADDTHSSGERAPTARRQPGILMHVHPVLPGVPRGALPAPAGGSTVRPARFEERAPGRLHCF